MKNLLSIALLALFTYSLGAEDGTPLNAQQTVEAYVRAFKNKDKDAMLRCLNDVYFEGYKEQYLERVSEYSIEKKEELLTIYEAQSIDDLKQMKGREIFSKFLDNPVSQSYWDGFDNSDLIIEYDTLAKDEGKSLIQSIMWIKDKPLAKIETRYFVVQNGEHWQIQAFQKRPYRPEPVERGQ